MRGGQRKGGRERREGGKKKKGREREGGREEGGREEERKEKRKEVIRTSGLVLGPMEPGLTLYRRQAQLMLLSDELREAGSGNTRRSHSQTSYPH